MRTKINNFHLQKSQLLSSFIAKNQYFHYWFLQIRSNKYLLRFLRLGHHLLLSSKYPYIQLSATHRSVVLSIQNRPSHDKRKKSSGEPIEREIEKPQT